MRILQINKYHYKRGGSDAVYFNTTKLLEQNGHEVHHFAMQYPENMPSKDSQYFAPNNDFVKQSVIRKIINTGSFFYSPQAANSLEQLIREVKPDIAHLHIFYGSLTSSILKVLYKEKIPVVVSVHDYKLICPAYLLLDGKNEICERCQGHNYYHCITNTCVKGSKVYSLFFALESYFRDYLFPYEKLISKFVFVSQFSKKIHLKFRGEIEKKSVHLYNFDPNIVTKIPIIKKGDYFLYAGRLSREKGLDTVVKAFKGTPHLKLKIAGDGPLREEILSKLTPNIEYLGFQSGKQLEEYIFNASYVIVPSEWYENNPLAIIEAYALGKPVVASSIGGIPEIVEDQRTGFLFRQGDEKDLIEKLVNADRIDKLQYSKISESARNFAEKNFNPDTHYQKLMEIYNSAIHKA